MQPLYLCIFYEFLFKQKKLKFLFQNKRNILLSGMLQKFAKNAEKYAIKFGSKCGLVPQLAA